MKAILLTTLLALIPLQVHADFLSGNELVKYMREADKMNAGNPQPQYHEAGIYGGFVLGVFDTYYTEHRICPPAGVTGGQAVEIISLYIKSNPVKWNLSASALVGSALKSAFACQ